MGSALLWLGLVQVMRVLTPGGRLLLISTMTLEVLRTALDGLLPLYHDDENFICRPLPTEFHGMVYAYLVTKTTVMARREADIIAAQQALQAALSEQKQVIIS